MITMGTSLLPKKTKLSTVIDFTAGGYTQLEAMQPQIETQLDAARDEFLAEKSISCVPQTLRAYKNALHLIFTFIPETLQRKPLNQWAQKDIDDITQAILSGKKINSGEPLSPVTKESYLRNLRIFTKWCANKSYIACHIIVRKYRAPQQPQKIYSEQEIYALAQPPELMHRLSFLQMRNYVMCMVLIETGIRKNSLLNIRICDLNLPENSIKITTSKNKHIYCVAISDNLVSLLDRYLANRITTDTTETDVLFCDQFQRKLTEYGVINILKKYVVSRGVTWRGVHAFRHSCATMMIKNGATTAEVAMQTGHRDIRQVENYARIVTGLRQDKFAVYSPLANMPTRTPQMR
jgi:integrase/recombinase XerD